ncbi:MAG: AAA-like domain-containing protein [Nostoc sp. DedVER02]|uniref:AAA-like domain-containing protein n=1 Tax=unclassified Nostoc TaxID=2593658 RepID=UPI002AD48A30|nr:MULTISPECIES: AAA-like domain-containing protein [unclassified Nostoc]MDZ7988963.1 AAA-like domain-containing protein [Nostoc sp. DedVER02]MDZ8114757.1 AAA-like domain-containing protein [Nostoc sp. DedVER01b]
MKPIDRSIPLYFDLETAINVIDWLVFVKTGKHLSTLQVEIIQGVWIGRTYEDISAATCWSEPHIKAIGAALWELMSEILNERVSKKNFRSVIERRYKDLSCLKSVEFSALFDTVTSESLPLEFPDGPVKLTSILYCDRPPIESCCYEAIAQPGSLLRIRAPKQMGKTSLLYRILNRAQQQEYSTILLNLQLVDSAILQDLDRFLQWFCARVTHALKLPLQLAEYWDDIFGSKTSCKDYFENYLLPQCQQPLVLALDEVDTLFAYPETADGFFSLLRAWYEDAKNSELWPTLRLILVHSTEAYVPLHINQSPFNVGIPIELPEFNAAQVKTLADWHQLNWTNAEVEQLMFQVGGHPYLVRLALYHIVRTRISLDELLDSALTTSSPFYHHLQRQLSTLEQQPSLVTALKAIIKAQQPVRLNSLELFHLNRMGLIEVQSGQVKIRCELYRRCLVNCGDGV